MLRVTAKADDLAPVFRGLEEDIAAATTAAMRGASEELKQDLRDQTRKAGLSNRLANTWRGTTYPEGRNALNPAGYVWSAAPDIADSFSTGATIRPLGGKHYVWVATKNVPRAVGGGRASSTKKMTPKQVLSSFGADDFVMKKGRGGHLLAFIVEGRGTTKRGGLRKVRKGRLGHAEAGQLVLMFTLTPSVKMPQAFDLDAAGNRAAADFVERFGQNTR